MEPKDASDFLDLKTFLMRFISLLIKVKDSEKYTSDLLTKLFIVTRVSHFSTTFITHWQYLHEYPWESLTTRIDKLALYSI